MDAFRILEMLCLVLPQKTFRNSI